jgi:hypothetical protein
MWNIGTLLYDILLVDNPIDNLPRISSMAKIELNKLTSIPWQERFQVAPAEIRMYSYISTRLVPLDDFAKSLLSEEDYRAIFKD